MRIVRVPDRAILSYSLKRQNAPPHLRRFFSMSSYTGVHMLRLLLSQKTAGMPREKLFWAVIGTLVLGQLLVLWQLCSGQVRRAQVHDVLLQVQRVALADCLRYVPKATLRGCERRVDPTNRTDWTSDKAAATFSFTQGHRHADNT
jgi:hypothetical protein